MQTTSSNHQVKWQVMVDQRLAGIVDGARYRRIQRLAVPIVALKLFARAVSALASGLGRVAKMSCLCGFAFAWLLALTPDNVAQLIRWFRIGEPQQVAELLQFWAVLVLIVCVIGALFDGLLSGVGAEFSASKLYRDQVDFLLLREIGVLTPSSHAVAVHAVH